MRPTPTFAVILNAWWVRPAGTSTGPNVDRYGVSADGAIGLIAAKFNVEAVYLMLASRLHMFGANIFLIIGAILLSIVAIGFLIALWTGVNILTWRRSQKRAAAKRHRERFDKTGQPYPPAARGLCSVCDAVHAKVYHLPDGTRFCPTHYAELIEARRPDEASQPGPAPIKT
ncbi:MAG: hypothetical protein R3E58_08635 [Phycisphaerae bacterium]|nr:hypothetical protein [Phycisphaerales bacterium]